MTSSSSHPEISSSGEPTDVTSFGAMTTESDWLDVNASKAYEYSEEYIEEFLGQKDDEFAVYVIPAMVYVGVLMVIGTPGNITVLLVYNRRLTTGTYRLFVQALAVFDLLNCLLGMPGEILDMRRNYTFGTSVFCKIFRAVTIFCSSASGVMLVMVAVDRYRHSCKPFSKQITPKIAKTMIAVCVVIGVIISAPASALYGSQTTLTGNPAINGSDCSTADSVRGTVYPMVFNGFHFLIFLSAAVTMIVLYSIIAHKMLLQARFRKSGFKTRGSRKTSAPSSSDTFGRSASSTKLDDCGDVSEAGAGDASAEAKENDAPLESKESKGSSEGQENVVWIEAKENEVSVEGAENIALTELKPSHVPTGGKDSKNDNSEKDDSAISKGGNKKNQAKKVNGSSTSAETRRLTRMLFMVTLVFILSFLPFLSMMVAKILEEASSPVNRGGWDLAWQNILMRSYFINSMANPIIYSFFSKAFRKECRRSLLRFRPRRRSQRISYAKH